MCRVSHAENKMGRKRSLQVVEPNIWEPAVLVATKGLVIWNVWMTIAPILTTVFESKVWRSNMRAQFRGKNQLVVQSRRSSLPTGSWRVKALPSAP
jgi:hypothetical protein